MRKKKAAKEKKYPSARRNNKGQVVVEDRIGEKKHKLLITADEELWADLWNRYDDDDYIMGEINYNYVQVALGFMVDEGITKTRGNSKLKPAQRQLVQSIKTDSRYFYVWSEYWKPKPLSRWPDSLKKLLQRLDIKIDRKNPHPTDELTRLVIENIHGSSAKVQEIKAFNNQNNYFKTYIMGDKNELDIIRRILVGSPGNEKRQDEIASLPKSDVVLNRIFKAHRVEP